MRNWYLQRDPFTSDKQTTGVLFENSQSTSPYKTLELAWNNNTNDISCIPEGRYLCRWTRSNRLSKIKGTDVYTYEILDVPGRSGIRIHSANFFYSLLGCVSLGDSFADIDKDGERDILNSRATIAMFNADLAGEDFILNVHNYEAAKSDLDV